MIHNFFDKLCFSNNLAEFSHMDMSSVTTNIQVISSFLVSITAFTAAVIGLVRPIRRWFVNQFKSYSNHDTNARIETLGACIDTVNQNLQSKIEHDSVEQERTKEAIKAILRNQMLGSYNRSEERGYIGDWDRDNFEQLFQIYTELGGNSYMHTVHEKILLMPRVPKTRKKTVKKKK